MEGWVRAALSAENGGVAIPAAFVFGILASVSSCCTFPVLGAVAGYAGGLAERRSRRELLVLATFFLVGTIVALVVMGAVAGFFGKVAGAALGKYWRLAAGLMLVVFGLVALRLFEIPAPALRLHWRSESRSLAAALVYGLALGGGTTACAFGCNPLLPMAMGAAVLRGATAVGATMLGVFAVGYSLPLAAGLVGIGIGVGHLGRIAQRVMPVARVVGGGLMIAVGFYLVSGA